MPTIKVNEELLATLHQLKKQLGCNSIQEAIMLAINYSSMLESFSFVNFEDVREKVVRNLGLTNVHSSFILQLSGRTNLLEGRMEELKDYEESINTLEVRVQELEKKVNGE